MFGYKSNSFIGLLPCQSCSLFIFETTNVTTEGHWECTCLFCVRHTSSSSFLRWPLLSSADGVQFPLLNHGGTFAGPSMPKHWCIWSIWHGILLGLYGLLTQTLTVVNPTVWSLFSGLFFWSISLAAGVWWYTWSSSPVPSICATRNL